MALRPMRIAKADAPVAALGSLDTRLGSDRSMYYAPTPVVAIDGSGRIVDFNLAFGTLLGGEAGIHIGEPVVDLEKRLAVRADSALFSSAHEDPTPVVSTHPCWHQTELYGRFDLRRTEVAHLDPLPGPRTLYWEILDAKSAERFFADLAEACAHQLVWESYAYSYDRILPRLPYYREAVARHVAAMATPGIQRILDIGAGTGNVALALWEANREVTALDLSHAMLEQLLSKLPPSSTPSVTALEQNAENLAIWPDGTFDGVTILLSLYDMARPDRALREAVRVLRPGGSIVVTEPRRRFQLQPLLTYVKRFLQETGDYEELHDDFERIHAANSRLDPTGRNERLWAEDIEAFLGLAGFRDIQVDDSHLGHCATIRGLKPDGPPREVAGASGDQEISNP